MFSNITISDLLMTIVGLGELVIKLFLLYIIWDILSWIFRTFIVPIVERRAYFFKYSFDTWYFERFRRIFWIFRLGLNKRWAIHKTLIGYVARSTFRDNQDSIANDIYVVGYFGRERVGQAKFIEGVCKIILRRTNTQGDEFNDNDPVGYIDPSGKVFKYYQDRNALLDGTKLKVPVFIGQCEDPTINKKTIYETEGEENDDDTLRHIIEERREDFGATTNTEDPDELHNQIAQLKAGKVPKLGDTWFSFRENYPPSKKVKTICLKSGGSVPDGRKRISGFGFWRYLQVYAFPWDFKRLGWGYGYCKEDFFRMPLKEQDNGIRLINRAGAALLLIEKEGLLDYEDERVRDNRKGMAATAILSLCLYYLGFNWIWEGVTLREWFPFLGTILSRVLAMVILFLFVWSIVHTFRKIMMDISPRFERFLEMLNRNTGVIRLVNTIIGICVLGLFFSYSIISYPFVALFISTLIAVVTNRIAFKQRKWEIDDPFNRRNNKEEDTNDGEEISGDDLDIKTYKWDLDTPIKTIPNEFEIKFSKKDILTLRLHNPFRKGSTDGETYANTVSKMIQDELRKPELKSYIQRVRVKINYIAMNENMSFLDKLHLILSFAQPPNIEHEFDIKCRELVVEAKGIPEYLIDQKEGGFLEYCRFPTESLYDKRGDCDCHAAIASALLASFGITSCYITGKVNDGSGHAAVGVECTPELLNFLKPDNYFVDHKSGKKFLYVETTGSQSKVGDMPEGFENMLNDRERQIAIIYPTRKD